MFIAAGSSHCGAITDKGHLYMWGLGSEGQLGNGYFSNAFMPERVTGEIDSKIVSHISLGGLHSGCITKEGYAYTWGNTHLLKITLYQYMIFFKFKCD